MSTPYINCSMWEIQRFPYDKEHRHPVSQVYWYNSLYPREYPMNYNDIQVPEHLILNADKSIFGMTLKDLCKTFIGTKACIVKQISDNAWIFDEEEVFKYLGKLNKNG